MAVEVRKLSPRPWGGAFPVVAYCNAHGAMVRASDMQPGIAEACWDQHGSSGAKAIVCIDCKQEGREVPLQLPQYADRVPFFRHWPGMAPDTSGHGETAEHIRGKLLVADWAADQETVLPWTVTEELWNPGVRLRSDVKARLLSGAEVAFEVQRKDLAAGEWERRHGGYRRAGIADVWLWPPDAPYIELDLPGTSVVVEVEDQRLGVLVADYGGRYMHPTTAEYAKKPTHYASAPMADWALSEHGKLVPPPELDQFIGTRPVFEQLALAERHRPGLYGPQGTPASVWSARPQIRHAAAPKRAVAAPTTQKGRRPSASQPSATIQPPSMTDLRRRRVPLSDADDSLKWSVLQRAGDRAELIDRVLYAAAVAAPDTFRDLAQRMDSAGDAEFELWTRGLKHCDRFIWDRKGLLGVANVVREQTAIVEAVLTIMGPVTEEDRRPFLLRGKVTEAVLRSTHNFSMERLTAVACAVWITGIDKGDPPFQPHHEIAAIWLISENIPEVLKRRDKIRELLSSGEPLFRTIDRALAMPPEEALRGAVAPVLPTEDPRP